MVIADFDEIIEKCQKYLENNPTIILGSGFSIPYGLPSMQRLSEEIKNNLTDNYKGDSSWESFVQDLDENGNLESALHKVHLNPNMYRDIINVTWEMINKLDSDLFSKFLENYEDYILEGLPYLFDKILQSHPRNINVVTPNYDRIVEYSADIVGAKVWTGFEGEYIKTFDDNDFRTNEKSSDKTITLCKVHGSLDWFKTDANHQLISIPNSRRIVKGFDPVIVTPGLNKYQMTHNEPFRTIIQTSDTILDAANAYLCVGYGFNDDHLQPKLLKQIQRNNKPIIVVTKTLSDKGKEVIKKTDKHIVFEEENEGYTRITYKNETYIEKGKYWQLNDFVNLWLG